MNSFTCVIPVYNNLCTIHDVIRRVLLQTDHVLVIDDGSTDTDLAAYYRDSASVEVVRHPRNLGKGAALRTALEILKARDIAYMLTLDGDGQHFPEDIPLFYPVMESNDWTLAVGCRDFNAPNVPEKSRRGRAISNFWIKLETGADVDDSQSGFRLYPVRYVSRLHFLSKGYNFETEILTRSIWANLPVVNIPIRSYYPKPEERISHFRPLRDNFLISCMHMHLIGIRLLPIPRKKLRPGPDFDFSLLHPKRFFLYLLSENATPKQLAAATFVGAFLAALPLFGLHTPLILYAASVLHLNRLMAYMIQHPFAPPVFPVICVEIGYFMTHGRWLASLSWQTPVRELLNIFGHWCLGSLILALPCALLCAVLVYFTAIFYRKLRRKES